MLMSRRLYLALSAMCLSLAFGSSALAAGPATVTVRVEGLNETKVPPTQVTTTTAPVVKDGNPEHFCPGTNAAGALELATAGNWGGEWDGGKVSEGKFEGLGYAVETIDGEGYPFSGGSFWDLWINNKAEEEHGVCGAEMQSGAQVLLFPCHYEEGKECPNPLGIDAPSSANIGEPVLVKVKKYRGSGEASPAAGATVTGGAAAAATDSSGDATLTFSSPGEYTLHATAPELVRTETTICVHNGNDGNCGTQASSVPATSTSGGGGSTAGGVAGSTTHYTGPYALVAAATGVIDGHVYRRGHAPRVLSGRIIAHSAVSSVSLALRRQYRRRCSAYDGVTERFRSARCGHASFFKVSANGLFSYLLPEALGPGRYVLDVQATDVAGNRTTLARGTSRLVFYVR
jgi:hypothetical protein